MQKRLKNKVISILTVIMMLLSACFIFASCGDDSGSGEEVTLKFNIQIYDDNNELICNLADQTITGEKPNIADATKLACETLELDIVVDTDHTVSQIGNLINGAVNTADDETEAETDENGEEISTEATEAEYYYWEVWVNDSKDPVFANAELKDGDSIVWKWVLWVDPDAE